MRQFRHTETGVLIMVDDATATFLGPEWGPEARRETDDPILNELAPEPAEETEEAPEEPSDSADDPTKGTGAFAKRK